MSFFKRLKKEYYRKRKVPWIPKETVIVDIDDLEEDELESEDNVHINESNLYSENIINSERMNRDNNINVDEIEATLVKKLVGRELVDEFLSRNFEPQGYNDALINHDSSNKKQNKDSLKYQLEMVIYQALTYYENKVKDYAVQIKAREENGMMDIASELESEKAKALEEIEKITIILNEARDDRGIGNIIILSYERGFNRGLAAITASLLGKK